IAYAPIGKPVSVQMNKLHGSSVKAQWYDPRNGTWKALGQFPSKGIQEFVAPSRGEQDDWLLVLDAE
ncbi:MAG TPA: putative collagen-binding domain-containing protein, partial [Verrucomicrobiae bacterium]|nr:putative collagen-binding domain-containing protein [Verrucomicrobiae bacterium]